MQTLFTDRQLADPAIAEAERVLRKCVHCGFCLATCPTYVLLGNELDSPRGRIYLIKGMLESDAAPDATAATHVDRCLSCLSCMTTCPSGVDYVRLVDLARDRIESRPPRPWGDRLTRWLVGTVLPRPALLRPLLAAAALARPFAAILPRRLAAMVRLSPAGVKGPLPEIRRVQGSPAAGKRVALLAGCVQSVVGAHVTAAAERLLVRSGCEVASVPDVGCCGALDHHLGRRPQAVAHARRAVAAWSRVIDDGGLDAIVVTTSGCGAVIKDYVHLLRDDPAWTERAHAVASRTVDVSEFLERRGLPPSAPRGVSVAYHDACSLRHGQKVAAAPRRLLSDAGFEVREPAEPHLCCGSAGTYNMLQPVIAGRLGARKAANLAATGADVVAAGNLGCMVQIAAHGDVPVVHTVELLDWATGGPPPEPLARGGGEIGMDARRAKT
jgi:glycolate oxidase iron-sulfur subunit